ncbi:DNAJ heat shock N-terminal domain-containing protein [Abeliophyllum distichum]|uniref:DNAJ heat shock N-terminal domain-containing protein n=1 Tax=Abeliophyllum distichum TaxID=126358 RepID=A0ABD1THR2_9LAMI
MEKNGRKEQQFGEIDDNDPETTNFCMFINEVYAVLSDPVQRMIYDKIHGYSLTAINPFLDDSSPKDHVFVDEFSCIGCKNCKNVCPSVFTIEEDFGRARAYSQSGNPESVQDAVNSCPVDCIHWTSAAQLSLLEDEMRREWALHPWMSSAWRVLDGKNDKTKSWDKLK